MSLRSASRLWVICFATVLGWTCFLPGCSLGKKSREAGKMYSMGAPVSVGALTYTVIDAEWREWLTGATAERLPKDRWLVVNVNVSNKSGGQAGLPLLTLVGADGKEYMEERNGEGVPQWLGLLRAVQPSQSDSGRLLFDVPPGGYKLRVSSGGDPETEATALVDIPFRAEAAPIKGVDPTAAPAAN